MLAELAIVSERPWSLGSAAVGLFAGGAVTVFGFAIAVSLIDPLTRRHARGEEAARWLPVKESSIGHVKETMQIAVTQAVYGVYGPVYATGRRCRRTAYGRA